MMTAQSRHHWAIRPRVPEELYTDRQEILEFLYQHALRAGGERSYSTVLLGQRRMGKTEIFLRVVNRLFWEQDHHDPKAVVPIYYSFEDEPGDRWEFSLKYVENVLRWYTAFRLREPAILDPNEYPLEGLMDAAKTRLPQTYGVNGMLKAIGTYQKHAFTTPEEMAVNTPIWLSDHDEIGVAVFLDEFQNTRLPDSSLRIVGYMQKAVESMACPHFVTGSAMSILTQEIIGRGALFGRFKGEQIEPMTYYWGAELALRAADYYRGDVPQEMAPVVASRCGGNPFYINAVVQQAALQHTPLMDEEMLNEILAVDLSSGFIWGELNDQVSKWVKRINEYGITKWILYLSALEEGEFLDLDNIQRELHDREGKDVPIDTIRDVLIKLSRGDLLECSPGASWFRKIDDPILVEFLKVWGRIEVEGHESNTVTNTLAIEYKKRERQFHEYKGYLGEVFMAQVLWNGQDKTLPGYLFHHDEDITLPWHFFYVNHRMRFKSGTDQEVDLLGAAGGDYWVCQSKWRADPVGIDVLQTLEAQGETLRQNTEVLGLRLWLFSYSGLHGNAEEYAKDHGILWSGKTEFDELLKLTGLRPLPDFS